MLSNAIGQIGGDTKRASLDVVEILGTGKAYLHSKGV
jgi:hypothetical protein